MIHILAALICLGSCHLGVAQENPEAEAPRPKVYYAHPVTLYDTEQEAQDVATLQKLGFDVVNPNDPEVDRQYKATKDFSIFDRLVLSCQAIAVRAFEDGRIGAGVFGEAETARKAGIPVFELPTNLCGRALTKEETKARVRGGG